MPTCSHQKIQTRPRRNEFGRGIVLILAAFLLLNTGSAQIYLPSAPPQPSDYGKVIVKTSTTTPVVFDHWLHRSKFTCRLCHVDIGFDMHANSTGITQTSIRQGFHCGACHDGKRTIAGKVIFGACSETPSNTCARCHSLGKPGAREYEYSTYTARFPKGIYGVDWVRAEGTGLIHPIDFLEGISVKRAPMQSRETFGINSEYSWVHPIHFSHEMHSVWNGCELCHPDIFPTAKRGTTRHSMFLNIEGRYCGACHGTVALPLNNCSQCHAAAPPWAQQN